MSFRVARKGARFELVIALLLIAPAATMGISMLQHGDISRVGFVGVALIVFALVGFTVWVQRRYAETGRLVVNDAGIGLLSDVPRWMGAPYQRAWSVAWNRIEKVAVLEPMGLVQIKRKGAMIPVALRVCDWVPEGAPEGPAPDGGGWRRRPDMRATALWKLLEARGLFEAQRADMRAEAVNFDLAKHQATRNALVVMALLAAYWAADVMLSREAWAEWRAAYIVPHFVIGAIGMLLAFRALKSATLPHPVPAPVAGGVALVLGLTVGLASWTGLVRVNQVVGGPLEAQAYVRNDACDTLLPVRPELPPIEYTGQAREYWCRFPKDQRHTVMVRKGLGGLYQVDLTEHTRAIREFRGAKRT